MSAEKELIVAPPQETALAVYSADKGLEPWLEKIRVKIDEFLAVVPDLKTAKGRKEIASMAYEVARTKTAIENKGKELSAEQKKVPGRIDAERKRVWDILETWQKEVRKPLDDWQANEDRRVDGHNGAILYLKDKAVFAETPTAAIVAQAIADLELVEINDSWEEFLAEAAQAKDRSLATLRTLLADRTKHEAELAEIARFNAEKAEREQKERDAEIARKAVEQARIEAEQKALQEREAAARRERELKNQAEAQQRAAEQKIRDAEAESERQRLQIKLQEEQAERQKLQAEQDRIAAEKRQAEAVEQARLAEIERANKAASEIVRQQELRAADTAHKASINRAALEAFIAGGMPEACAKQAVTLIAQRRIPNINIQY
ncbi:hypothetical protein V2J93_17025 [Pseudomonas alliivorans]|nr:hypothetical protein [Pseudomonas alliivorans]